MTNEELIQAGRAATNSYGDGYQVALIAEDLADALESVTAERDAALAVIAQAIAQTKRGNLATPPWVVAALNGEGSK